MKFIYDKKFKRVSFFSEGDIKVDPKKFNILNYTPTAGELTKLMSNQYDLTVENNALIFTFNLRGQAVIEKVDLIDKIDKIKKGQNTKEELADLLNKLTAKIYN